MRHIQIIKASLLQLSSNPVRILSCNVLCRKAISKVKEKKTDRHFCKMWERPSLNVLEQSLTDSSNNPIGMRMRAAYYLRQEYHDVEYHREKVIDILSKNLKDESHGSLMRHEFAYVLGQLRDERACDVLEEILGNTQDCVMVRHEAAEALGAIGAERSEKALRHVMMETSSVDNEIPELAETCRIALNVMEWRKQGSDAQDSATNGPPAGCACMWNPYSSVDPAPPHPAHADLEISALGDILCDEKVDIFERYRVMFSLRNLRAARELCRGFHSTSALFRHEIAYVLGQLQDPLTVEALEDRLRDRSEHRMVRHEAAEALGAIEGRWNDVERILQEFTEDDDMVVRESCLVALDAADYWGHAGSSLSAVPLDGEVEEVEERCDKISFTMQKNQDQKLVVSNHFNILDASS
jgi:deoxyhypusine monooxygenase